MSKNPFYLRWNKGWIFFLILEGGIAKIQANGFGISMKTNIIKGESPIETADRLIIKEQRRRKSLYYSWLRSLNKTNILKWFDSCSLDYSTCIINKYMSLYKCK